MRNYQNATLIIVQSYNQRIHSVNVQVIGWLIKNQNLGIPKQAAGQRNSTLLSTGKQIHRPQLQKLGNPK